MISSHKTRAGGWRSLAGVLATGLAVAVSGQAPVAAQDAPAEPDPGATAPEQQAQPTDQAPQPAPTARASEAAPAEQAAGPAAGGPQAQPASAEPAPSRPAAQPAPVEPAEQPRRLRYNLDPVSDTVVTSVALIAAVASELTLASGELLPQQDLGDVKDILFIDRPLIENGGHVEETAPLTSNIGAAALISYAVIDSVRSGYRDGSDEGWTELLLYVQGALINASLANVVKLAVRRPRPRAYLEVAEAEAAAAEAKAAGTMPSEMLSTETNRELSFYSGHAAISGGLAATASYLAFERSGSSAEAWTIFGVTTAVTGFVSFERVRSKAHFPTDVIAGAIFGAAVGILVPHAHLNRDEDGPTLSVWAGDRAGGLALTALH